MRASRMVTRGNLDIRLVPVTPSYVLSQRVASSLELRDSCHVTPKIPGPGFLFTLSFNSNL